MDEFDKDELVFDIVHTSEEQQTLAGDPLDDINQFSPPPFKLHFVQPHFVEGYMREDGTAVSGYYRDGALGIGYARSNADGLLENNLKK